MSYETNPEYQRLIGQWKEYKETENLCNERRLKVERDILQIVGRDLNEKGTNNFPLGLKITTGISESWDADSVDRIKNQYDDGVVSIPFFPFKQEWKPDNKKLAMIREDMPAVFERVFSGALTIKPKKPSFEIRVK